MLSRRSFMVLTCGATLFGLSSLGYAGELKFEHHMNIGSTGRGPAQFKYVEDFAFTKSGHLLATDAANANIQVFDKTTGKYLSQFGGKGDDDHHFEKPEGIAVAPDGTIFVADYTTGYIKKFTPDYQWVKTFSDYGEAPGENIKSEFMSIYNGLLYMPEAGNHRVDVFDMDGNFKFLFGGKGTAPGKMNNPEAAKYNSEGRIYVADLKNDRVQVFDKDGNFLFLWGRTGSGPGEFKAPSGLAIDKHDNVYLCEIGNDRVQVFDKAGNFLTMWGQKGAGDGEFGNLHGIIVDHGTGWVYVADTANDRIQVFKPKAGLMN